jgi:hypothetical protein
MKERLLRSVALALTTVAALSVSAGFIEADGGVTVTILHNNDGESRLLNAGDGLEDYGGAARFKTVVDNERAAGNNGADNIAVLLSSGDNFLAGPQFQTSLDKGMPYYDSIVVSALGYDAMAIDFTARGGDQYPFESDFVPLGVSYQQALANYIAEALGGMISATQYPEGGDGRIIAQ